MDDNLYKNHKLYIGVILEPICACVVILEPQIVEKEAFHRIYMDPHCIAVPIRFCLFARNIL